MPKRRTGPSLRHKKATKNKAELLTPEKMADNLHHTVCQCITGARFLMSAFARQLPREASELVMRLENVDAVLEESCTELRALIRELRSTAGANRTLALGSAGSPKGLAATASRQSVRP